MTSRRRYQVVIAGGQARLVLVHPDQHVAWYSDRPPLDPAALLAKAAGLFAGGEAG